MHLTKPFHNDSVDRIYYPLRPTLPIGLAMDSDRVLKNQLLSHGNSGQKRELSAVEVYTHLQTELYPHFKF